MASNTIELTVEGQPGEEFQVWYRGNAGNVDPEVNVDPAPIVHTGKLDANGRATVTVPRDYLALGRPVRRGGTRLPLHEETGPTATAKLPPEK